MDPKAVFWSLVYNINKPNSFRYVISTVMSVIKPRYMGPLTRKQRLVAITVKRGIYLSRNINVEAVAS
jgi:hypothetical protein